MSASIIRVVQKKKEAREQQQQVSDIGIGFFMDRGRAPTPRGEMALLQ
jgi:hypothetical protein